MVFIQKLLLFLAVTLIIRKKIFNCASCIIVFIKINREYSLNCLFVFLKKYDFNVFGLATLSYTPFYSRVEVFIV